MSEPFYKKVLTRRRQRNYPSGYVEISVKDTGIGILAENLDNIFDRFYQAEGLIKYEHKGSGIGLALTREFVKLHHGEITVRSEVGKGSEFIVRLPLGKEHLKSEEILEQSERAAQSAIGDQEALLKKKQIGRDYSPPTWTSTKTFPNLEGEEPAVEESEARLKELDMKGENVILVVEDNADVRAYIREPLQPLYRVKEAENGEEGIEKAREIIPDLIISDVMMPQKDGFELCKVLKQDVKTSHIPIILLTAKASEESIIAGLETGADDYITKPFSTKILCARIKNLIDLRTHLQQTINREMTLQPAKMSVSKVDKEFLKDLETVLNNNISDPDFNVEELCRKLYMGRTTLYRKIHALSGESPTEFIRSYRLKWGAELLKGGRLTVLEVAFEVGFSSANYFTKCFKKKFHQLPTSFKEIES